jgi:hypothetical protein
MEALRTSEASVDFYEATPRHIPKAVIFNGFEFGRDSYSPFE